MDVPAWLPGSVLTPLRTGGNFELYRARDEHGAGRLVLMASRRLGAEEAERRVGRIAHVHGLVAGPLIPRPAGVGCVQGRHYVALDCDVVSDAEALATSLLERGERLPYAGTIGALFAIGTCLERVHATVDPTTGRACALGSLPLSGLLYEPSGAFWLIGFGDPGLARDGSLPTPFVAPELALGGEPTPATDVVALATLMRSTVPYVDLPPVLARVLGGGSGPSDAAVAAVVHGLNSQVWGLPPSLRPSLPTVRRALEAMLRLLGVTPDVTLLEQSVRQWLARSPSAPPPTDAGHLALAADASWFSLPAGARVSLTARTTLRRVLLCLAEAHERGRPSVDVWELLEAGWPGENPLPAAGANRVYAAIAALRRMGLRDDIERYEAGYRLTPGLRLVRDPAPLA